MIQMAAPNQYPGFKALLLEWNKRLYESGFRDIETMAQGELKLKKSGAEFRYLMLDPIVRENNGQFFRRLQQHVSETKFPNENERLILTLYSQGARQSDIYRLMNIEGHRSKVYRPIYKWLRIWFLK